MTKETHCACGCIYLEATCPNCSVQAFQNRSAEILQALENYLADLTYWIGGADNDASSVNFHTSGTPEFKAMPDAEQYAEKLADLITSLRRG